MVYTTTLYAHSSVLGSKYNFLSKLSPAQETNRYNALSKTSAKFSYGHKLVQEKNSNIGFSVS